MQPTKSKRTRGKKSRYAQKVASDRQMYGPGCCGHRLKSRLVKE